LISLKLYNTINPAFPSHQITNHLLSIQSFKLLSMAFSKSVILALLVVATMSNIHVEARRLLQRPDLPQPKVISSPTPSMQDLPDMSVIPSLPKGSLPPLHTSIPSLPKHAMPPFPTFPSTESSPNDPLVSSPAPSHPESSQSFFSFPFFSRSHSLLPKPSVENP
ncbi:hypothetical protein KIW84_072570, partial [Lathyrus oleraceus]